ncbi:hypothetical protein DER45DRAFT_556794 [Fusarium avenaceum]|nr:hypothetical protein DER45DRAFT_556794 [Fusarium avenaceum]
MEELSGRLGLEAGGSAVLIWCLYHLIRGACWCDIAVIGCRRSHMGYGWRISPTQSLEVPCLSILYVLRLLSWLGLGRGSTHLVQIA